MFLRFGDVNGKGRQTFVDKLICAYPQLGEKYKWTNKKATGYLDRRYVYVRFAMKKQICGMKIRQKYL